MTGIVIDSGSQRVTYLGQTGDTGVTRVYLGDIELSQIRSIRIEDDNFISGGTGIVSGYDLDYATFSTEFTSSAYNSASLNTNLINFNSANFSGGYLQPVSSNHPSEWNGSILQGSNADGTVDASNITFSILDGQNDIPAANEDIDGLSLGEGGTISFDLFEPLNITSDLYLYLADIGGGNDGYRVVISDSFQNSSPSEEGVTLYGSSLDDSIRLGEGINSNNGNQNDSLFGYAGDDSLFSADGDDTLTGGAGNDTIDGGNGTDTSAYTGSYANFSITSNSEGITVSDSTGENGTDFLLNVERLKFDEKSIAFDLDGNAGIAAKTLGAVFGNLTPELVGIGIGLLDQGTSYDDLMQLAIDARLGADYNNSDAVDLLYQNVVGVAPSVYAKNLYTSMLDNGIHSVSSLGVLAAETTLNQNNVDIVGLSSTGLDYIPSLIG